MVGGMYSRYNQIPYLPGGIGEVLPQEWEFWASRQAPQSGGLILGEGAPEHLALKASGAWSQELHRAGGSRNSTLGGRTQGIMCTRTQGKKQRLHRSLGLTYLLVLEDLLGRWGQLWLTAGTRALVAEVLGSAHWCELSWRPPFWHQDLAPPNSPKAPVLGCLRPKELTGQEHNSTHQRTSCLKSSWAQSCL